MKDGQDGQMGARTRAIAQWKSICLAKPQFHLHPPKTDTYSAKPQCYEQTPLREKQAKGNKAQTHQLESRVTDLSTNISN